MTSHPTTDERFDAKWPDGLYGPMEIDRSGDECCIVETAFVKEFIASEISLALKEKEEQMVKEIETSKKPEVVITTDDFFGMMGMPSMKPVTLTQLLELEKNISENKARKEDVEIIKRIMNTSDV